MPIPTVKIVRRFLIGVIFLVLLLVLGNYIQNWRNRSAARNEAHPILSSEMTLSAEGMEYSENRSGTARFKLRAKKRLETIKGKNFLQGIEAFNFNPDGSVKNSIHSKKAEFDQARGLIYFSEDVKIWLSEGLELLTHSLHYDQNTSLGATEDRLELHSSSTTGSASGIRFDQKNGLLDLRSDVDLIIIQKRTHPDGATEDTPIHITSEKASLSESLRLIQFQGAARIKTETESLSGDRIEAVLSADQKHFLSLTSIGNAAYQAKESQETRNLSGNRIEMKMEETSGALQRVRVMDQASFSSIAKFDAMNLRAAEIILDIEPGNGFPTQVRGGPGVQFDFRNGNEQNKGSGNEFTAAFTPGTKNLESIQISGRAAIHKTGKDLAENDLEAENIRLFFKEVEGRSALEKFQASNAAKWISRPSNKSEISKKLLASFLEVSYASKGEYPDSGVASGDVSLNAIPAKTTDAPFLRQLLANYVRFHFYPGNSQLKDLYAEGRVRVDYEKTAEKKAARQKFHTESDKMQVDFQASSNESAIEKAVQWGNFRYSDEFKNAVAGRCDYEAGKERLILKESPKIIDSQTGTTSGEQIEYHQKQKMLYVHRGVRSILSSKKGDSSLFGSSDSASPAVVTADEMRYSSESEQARYTGDVLLLSADQRLQSNELEIFNGGKQVAAQGEIKHSIYRAGSNPSKTNSPKRDSKKNNISTNMPINVQSAKLRFVRETNIIHYSGDVNLQTADYSISSETLDVQWDKEVKRIKRATGRDKVVIHNENRIGKGDIAEYYLDPERFEIIGSPARIEDPAKMRSFGRRLTFFVVEEKTQFKTE